MYGIQYQEEGETMIIIDYKDRRPLYEQIVERFSNLIIKGVLPPDSKLPSVRNLAVELSMNPNTIQRAYAEMERLGFIYSVKGKGNFVAIKEELLQSKQKEVFTAIDKLIEISEDVGITEEKFISYVREGFKGGKE